MPGLSKNDGVFFLKNDLAFAKPINERKLISILFEKLYCFLKNPRLLTLVVPKVFHDEVLDICEAGNFSKGLCGRFQVKICRKFIRSISMSTTLSCSYCSPSHNAGSM